MNKIKINKLKHKYLAKCSTCKRTRDIYFDVSILDSIDNNIIAGKMQLCLQCGENLSSILGYQESPAISVYKNFEIGVKNE